MRKENGYTGVDIAISLVVISIFVTIIGTLVFNFSSSKDEMEYKSQALDYAINIIEDIKTKKIEEITEENEVEIINNEDGHTGFYKKVDVTDAINIEGDFANRAKIENLVKKVTVTISYKFRKQIKSIELSTVISKDF